VNLKTKIFAVLFCFLLNDLFSSDWNISEPETIIDLPDELICKKTQLSPVKFTKANLPLLCVSWHTCHL
jgi:hypothetical protein